MIEDGLVLHEWIILRGRKVVAIVVDNETRLVVQGLTGREGSFHGVRNRDYGTNVVAGVTPGKGGDEVEGIPSSTPSPRRSTRRGPNTAMVFVPARFATDAVYEAVDAGIETVICIAEGLPRTRCCASTTTSAPKGITMLGPNCPARSRREGQRRDHSRPRSSARAGRACRPLGDAHVPDRTRVAQLGLGNSTIVGIGGDPVVGSLFIDDPRPVRGRRRDRPRRHGRRDRRRRGGEGRRLHPGRDVEAGRRLHRRLHRAAREDDGPRRRDHLGHLGDGPGEAGGARGRGVRVGTTPTEVAQLASEVVAVT